MALSNAADTWFDAECTCANHRKQHRKAPAISNQTQTSTSFRLFDLKRGALRRG